MTKKDFFTLIVKLYALYVMVEVILFSVPDVSASFSYGNSVGALWMIIMVIIVVALFWLLISKANSVVEVLNLDKGFQEDRIEFGNLKAPDLIKISVFVIGGFLMIDNIPELLSQIYWAFKGEIAGRTFDERDKFTLVVKALNVIVGYLLMTNYEFVANRFEEKKPEE